MESMDEVQCKAKEYADLLQQLKAGGTTLKEIERETRRRCRKISLAFAVSLWTGYAVVAREGALVTGVDISRRPLVWPILSQELTSKRGLSAQTSTTCPTILDEQFDIVCTSGGVLNWLLTYAGGPK